MQTAASGSVVRVQADGSAEVLAAGLAFPSAVGSYPTYSSPATGLSVIIRVDSPVDVLLTAPDGRQIGVDPATGLPVNDFGESGFDSGPGEPRFFGIRDSVPGDWSIAMIGTADGPFAINVYGIDLDQSTGDRARMTGTASIGSQLATIFRLDAAATVELFPPGDYNRNGTVDAADYVLWRKTFGQSVAYGLGADGDGSGTIDDADLAVWRSHFGQTTGSGSGASTNAAVPEPTTLFLLTLATARGCLRRRRAAPKVPASR